MPRGQVAVGGRSRWGLALAGWAGQLSGGPIRGAWIVGAWIGPSRPGLHLAPPPGPAAGIGLQGGIVQLAGIGQGPGPGQPGRRFGVFWGPKQVALQGCFG